MAELKVGDVREDGKLIYSVKEINYMTESAVVQILASHSRWFSVGETARWLRTLSEADRLVSRLECSLRGIEWPK